jgi:diketogulonate reductase-like aldo/keto reductase
MSVPDIALETGVTIPQVGYGVFQIPPEQTQESVERALEAGYRHIDTAAGYGNEAGVGAAIRVSGLPREEVFVTTKLRNGDQGARTARQAFENSRELLGLDVVDLYLIHWPRPSRGQYVETWQVFEQLHAEGSIRAIGVSNFLPDHLAHLMEHAEVTPAVNQIEVHPSFAQPGTQQATREHGIVVEAYAPLGQAQDLAHAAVRSAAKAHGVSPAQVVLRWHLQQGTIVIPKSVTPERIRSNIDLFGFELSEPQMDAISSLDSDQRMFPDPQNADFD